ncbi:hypothetical protein NCS52_00307000 [Fusarium sp. LHS14.1]|nr:hypothetical protein NCS52_00307000 [Fusarium sp. LHS14.1]
MLPPSPPPSPSPNAKISNDKDKRNKYVYIDHSNFWISCKIATGDKNWRYDVKSFTSLLTSKSLSTETTGSHNAQVHIYGYVPDDLKELWTNEHAKVHKLKKPHPLDTKEEVGDEKKETKRKKKKNTEKEVDTRLVADSVAEAAKALHERLKDT